MGFADYGMRDITDRYASKYLSPEMRRIRIDSEWWEKTMKVS